MSIVFDNIKLYSIKETSDILKITTRTLTTYIKEQKILARKIGGKWYISEKNLKEFLEKNNNK